MGIYWLSGYYNHVFQKSRLQELLTTGTSSLVATLLIYFALLTNDQVELRSTNYMLVAALFFLIGGFTYIGRYSITSSTLRHFRDGSWGINTLVIGNTIKARQTAGKLATPSLGYRLVGYVNIPGEENISDNSPAYDISEIKDVCSRNMVKMVMLVPTDNGEITTLGMLPHLFDLHLPIKVQPDTLSILTAGIRLRNIYEEPMLDLTGGYASDSTRNIKRAMDVAISALALLVLAIPMLGVALWIKSDSRGPVIYSQERMGYKRRRFRIYKFRSMYADAESNGPQLSSHTDKRITRAGHLMRKYRIDELPQFWNILKGDMSLVGPRPEREYYATLIQNKAPWYTLVYQVRPGLTSWGMVKYGYASDIDQMVARLKYDLVYLENISIGADLKIMLSTVKTVITGRGV